MNAMRTLGTVINSSIANTLFPDACFHRSSNADLNSKNKFPLSDSQCEKTKKTFEELCKSKKKKSSTTKSNSRPNVKNNPLNTEKKKNEDNNHFQKEKKKNLKKDDQQKLTPREEKLLTKLKNFDDIDNLFENIEKHSKEYQKLFKEESKTANEKPEINSKIANAKYKPVSGEEEKQYKRIDSINKQNDIEQLKMLGKKHRTTKEGSSTPAKRKDNDNAIFCSICQVNHGPDVHKTGVIPPKIDYKKIFGGTSNDMKKALVASEKKIATNKVDSIKKPVPALKPEAKRKIISQNLEKATQSQNKPQESKKSNDIINKIKTAIEPSYKKDKSQIPDIKSHKVKGIFSKEDFEDDDDFIVHDDEEENNPELKKYLQRINLRFRRGGGNYLDDDGEIEEANFDTIQREEKTTAMIGEYEDYQEELRNEREYEIEHSKLKNKKK